jgi:4-hydroxythreonine-4-phosphate dehydrogenase
MKNKPTIGITMGDPSGIGPQIVAKALQNTALNDKARFVIYGSNESLTLIADRCKLQVRWDRVDANSPRALEQINSNVIVLDDGEDGLPLLSSKPSQLGGIVSKRWVESAIHDALLPKNNPRNLDAVVTAPICKESWFLAGYKWPGHTELFSSRTNAKRHAMMFISEKLKVVLTTCHVPLMDIRNVLTIGKIYDSIDLASEGCKQLGIKKPKIAITGLNPHAGENGLLGDEERRLICPAIKMASNNGIQASGPFPADTIFSNSDSFDVVVAMYHDQGLLPIKLLSPQSSVNWTLGLPIIRTSPDHGTAFDIAATNHANPNSLLRAIDLAYTLSTSNRMLKSQL